jgi:hypothetical protein
MLRGQSTHAPGGAGDDHHIAGGSSGRDRGHSGIGGRADGPERTGHLPRDGRRAPDGACLRDDCELRLAATLDRRPEHLVAGLEVLDARSDPFDHAGDVVALCRREAQRDLRLENPATQLGLERVDARCLDAHDDLFVARLRWIDIDHLEYVHSTVPLESDRTWHRE